MPGKGVKNGMKKRGSILSLLCVLVLGCTFFVSCKDRSQELNQVDYEVGVYSDKNWEESVGTYQGDAIPDEETALAVAQGIFQGIEKSQAAEQYRPQVVFYDQEDEIWIVSFGRIPDRQRMAMIAVLPCRRRMGRYCVSGSGSDSCRFLKLVTVRKARRRLLF